MSSDILRYERPALTADCVLFTAVEKEDEPRGGDLVLQVRLVRRPNEPEEGKWALLGAFVPVEERIEDTMRRAALEKGGMQISMLNSCTPSILLVVTSAGEWYLSLISALRRCGREYLRLWGYCDVVFD